MKKTVVNETIYTIETNDEDLTVKVFEDGTYSLEFETGAPVYVSRKELKDLGEGILDILADTFVPMENLGNNGEPLPETDVQAQYPES